MTKELVAELRALRLRLKSGEYTGVDVMRAWIAVEDYANLLESSAHEPSAPHEHQWETYTSEGIGRCIVCGAIEAGKGLEPSAPRGMTIAEKVEATLYGNCRHRDGDFLAVAADVLKMTQAEVDAAVAAENSCDCGNPSVKHYGPHEPDCTSLKSGGGT